MSSSLLGLGCSVLGTLEEDEGADVEAVDVPSLVTTHRDSACCSAGCEAGDIWTPGAKETLLLWVPPADTLSSCCLLGLLPLPCFSGDEGERESCGCRP